MSIRRKIQQISQNILDALRAATSLSAENPVASMEDVAGAITDWVDWTPIFTPSLPTGFTLTVARYQDVGPSTRKIYLVATYSDGLDYLPQFTSLPSDKGVATPGRIIRGLQTINENVNDGLSISCANWPETPYAPTAVWIGALPCTSGAYGTLMLEGEYETGPIGAY